MGATIPSESLSRVTCHVSPTSYTSHAGFFFIWGVSLTHPVQVSFFFSPPPPPPLSFFPFSFFWGVPLTHPAFFYFFLLLFSPFYVASFSGMQSSLKTTPKERSWVKDGPDKKCEKVTLKKKKEPYNTLYRAEQNQTRTEWQMATEKKGE